MKIIGDKKNQDKCKYLKNTLLYNQEKYFDNNLTLELNNNQIILLNHNYKPPVSISIDFLDQSFIKKIDQRLNQSEIFLKIFQKKHSKILDCTAGFGRDSYLLRSLGFNLVMIEKNPVISLILKHAVKKIQKSNFYLYHGDALDFLNHTDMIFDYIYFDFMFNKSKNKSLSSKNDEVLKILAEDDDNREELIDLAITKCRERVVIKGPIHNNNNKIKLKPNYSITSKLLKYDMYLAKNE